jgi:membrane-associated phospholipid phosphatase
MIAVQRSRVVTLAILAAILLAFTVDQPIARAMAGIDPHILRITRFISLFGQGGIVLYPTGVMTLVGLAIRYLRPELRGWLDPAIRAFATIFVVVAVAGLADDALKIVFGRARPYLWLKGDVSGFGFFRYGARFASFPSGHTTTSFAAAFAFSALWPRWRAIFFGTALAIAVTRIMLNAHYLSDVIAGAALGGGIAIAILSRQRRRGWLPYDIMRNKRAQDSGPGYVDDYREKKKRRDRN